MASDRNNRVRPAAHGFSIVWKRIDYPGHEWCSLTQQETGVILKGVVVVQWGRLPCNIEYVIKCSTDWKTKAVTLIGNIGPKQISVTSTQRGAGTTTENSLVR